MMIFSLAKDIGNLSIAVLGTYKKDLEPENELHHELDNNDCDSEDTIGLEQIKGLERL